MCLLSASLIHHNSLVKTLLEKGEDPNVQKQTKSGVRTPLIAACMWAHQTSSAETALLLLAYGANPDWGVPGLAIECAANFELHYLVLELLACGADPRFLKPEEMVAAVYHRPDRANAIPRERLVSLKSFLSRALEEASKLHARLQLCFAEDSERMGYSQERSERHADEARAMLDCAAVLVEMGADKSLIASSHRHHLELNGF